jgi:hypothetical protein
MTDRFPHAQRGPVLVGVKAKPSGWPTASLDPDSGRGRGRVAERRLRRITNLVSLRFEGIAATHVDPDLNREATNRIEQALRTPD